MTENKQNKKILLYMPVPCILICGASILQAVDVSKVDLLYYCAGFLAVAIGAAHVIALNKLIPEHRFGTGLYITIAVMTVATVIAVVVYSYASLNLGFLTIIFAFIIPYLSWHAYLQFLQIV